jgi:hypothetical protein
MAAAASGAGVLTGVAVVANSAGGDEPDAMADAATGWSVAESDVVASDVIGSTQDVVESIFHPQGGAASGPASSLKERLDAMFEESRVDGSSMRRVAITDDGSVVSMVTLNGSGLARVQAGTAAFAFGEDQSDTYDLVVDRRDFLSHSAEPDAEAAESDSVVRHAPAPTPSTQGAAGPVVSPQEPVDATATPSSPNGSVAAEAFAPEAPLHLPQAAPVAPAEMAGLAIDAVETQPVPAQSPTAIPDSPAAPAHAAAPEPPTILGDVSNHQQETTVVTGDNSSVNVTQFMGNQDIDITINVDSASEFVELFRDLADGHIDRDYDFIEGAPAQSDGAQTPTDEPRDLPGDPRDLADSTDPSSPPIPGDPHDLANPIAPDEPAIGDADSAVDQPVESHADDLASPELDPIQDPVAADASDAQPWEIGPTDSPEPDPYLDDIAEPTGLGTATQDTFDIDSGAIADVEHLDLNIDADV